MMVMVMAMKMMVRVDCKPGRGVEELDVQKANAELWQLGKLGGQVDVVEGEDEDQDEDAVVCREWRYVFLKK